MTFSMLMKKNRVLLYFTLATVLGSLSLLQQIFPTQESNQGLLHCRQILYQLSHKGSPVWRMGLKKGEAADRKERW